MLPPPESDSESEGRAEETPGRAELTGGRSDLRQHLRKLRPQQPKGGGGQGNAPQTASR